MNNDDIRRSPIGTVEFLAATNTAMRALEDSLTLGASDARLAATQTALHRFRTAVEAAWTRLQAIPERLEIAPMDLPEQAVSLDQWVTYARADFQRMRREAHSQLDVVLDQQQLQQESSFEMARRDLGGSQVAH